MIVGSNELKNLHEDDVWNGCAGFDFPNHFEFHIQQKKISRIATWFTNENTLLH